MALSVRFNSPYLQPYSHDPLSLIIHTMGTAQRTLDLCTDHLTLEPVVVQAAVMRGRGIKVRWIVDLGGPGNGAEASATEKLLNKYGFRKHVDWRAYQGAKPMMHQRYMLIDGHRVWMGSTRFSPEGIYLQDNLDVVVDSPQVGAAFAKATDTYWNECASASAAVGNGKADYFPELCNPVEDVFVGPEQRVSAYFSPYDGRILLEKLVEVIGGAEQSVHFAFPSLAEPQLIEALEERARAGVYVTGVLDARLCQPEHFNYAPAIRADVLHGKIRVMQPFAKSLGGGGYHDGMQVKTVTVDGQWTYAGSATFEAGHSPYQSESALIIDSGPVARQCAGYVEALFELAKNGGHRVENCRGFAQYKAGAGGELPFKIEQAAKRPSTPPKYVVAPKTAKGYSNGAAKHAHANGSLNGKATANGVAKPAKTAKAPAKPAAKTAAKTTSRTRTSKLRKAAPAGVSSWAKRKARASARKRAGTKGAKKVTRVAA